MGLAGTYFATSKHGLYNNIGELNKVRCFLYKMATDCVTECTIPYVEA